MAQNLNKTRRRIASINSTKKITNAMELVSTVKLKKYRRIMDENRLSQEELTNFIHALFSVRKADEISLYEKENNASQNLVIVISSNLGLCASFNNDIIKYVDSHIDKEKDVILSVGSKGNDYFKRNGYNVDETFLNLTDRYTYDDVISLSKYLMTSFRQDKYHSIRLVFTHYVNSIHFVPDEIKLLPLDVKSKDVKDGYRPLYDPDYKTLVDEVVPLYIASLLYQKILESLVSEQASRRNAMESATDNANELIDELTLEYNKARQTSITQEITEVVSASLDK